LTTIKAQLPEFCLYEVLKLYWPWVIIFVTDLQLNKNMKVTNARQK
jgi:hypothetical protein